MPVRRARSMLSNLLARLGVQRRQSPPLRRRGATAPEMPGLLRAEASRAEEAAARGDWPRALGVWSALLGQYPDPVAPAVGRGVALVELGRLDEAEALLAAAAQRFPEDPRPLTRYGWVAVRRGDWPEALRRSQALRQRFPDLAEGHIGVGEALRQAGRLDEADAVLGVAAAKFRATPWPAILHARVAVSRGDWLAALARWQQVMRRFPRAGLAGYLGAAEAHVHLGQTEPADAALRAAVGCVLDDYAAGLELAQAALRLQRWEVGAALWQALLAHYRNERPEVAGAVEMLQAAGRLAEADAVAHSAARRFPTCEAAWFAAIRLALARADRPGALGRWREMVRHVPAPSAAFLDQRQAVRKELALSAPGFDPAGIDLKGWVVGSVICEDPVILLTTDEVFQGIEAIAPYYRGRTVYCFVGMLWTLSFSDYRQRFVDGFGRLADRHPNLKITVLANDAAELIVLRELGIPAELVNHNAFIDDRVFDILPVAQIFDAIYNARLGGYKRHHLAQGIANLKLIVTGATPENLAQTRTLLPGCVVANQQGDAIGNLTAHEVAYHLNTAKCGLCLSPYEGAMFASVEYLLCGLPIVTTRNTGGRNWFFSDDYVITCDDDAAAVAAAVARLGREPISRQLIRESTRQKMRRERLIFFDLVDRLFRELGQEQRRIEPEFAKWYRDKINYTGRQIEDVLVP